MDLVMNLVLIVAFASIAVYLVISRGRKVDRIAQEYKENLQRQKKQAEAIVFLRECSMIEGLNIPSRSNCELSLYKDNLKIVTNGVKYSLDKDKIIGASIVDKTELTGAVISDIGGAIVGGLLFGNVGAIIGGMPQSTTEQRMYFILNYYDRNDKVQVLCVQMPVIYTDAIKSSTEQKDKELIYTNKNRTEYIKNEIALLKMHLCNAPKNSITVEL